MASNISKKEKQLTVKRISETLKNIDKWMIVCEEGKPIIQEILAAKKDLTQVSFFHQCSKIQLIPLQKFNIQTCFFQFFGFSA